MQVRKHKEQAEWAEKKYAELERYDASSVQAIETCNDSFAGQRLCLRAKVFATNCSHNEPSHKFV